LEKRLRPRVTDVREEDLYFCPKKREKLKRPGYLYLFLHREGRVVGSVIRAKGGQPSLVRGDHEKRGRETKFRQKMGEPTSVVVILKLSSLNGGRKGRIRK